MMKVGIRNKLLRGLLAGLAGALIAFIPWAAGVMDSWEAKTWDWRATLLAKPGKATQDIRLILLDQKSLEWARRESSVSWPWPREFYGAVIDFCRRSKVKALAFDVLFEDPSGYGIEDDRKFGRAVATFGHVAASVALNNQDGTSAHWPGGTALPAFNISGLNPAQMQSEGRSNFFRRATMPIAEVAQNATILSNVTQNPDPDGIYRKLQVFGVFDGQILPALGLGNYLAAKPAADIQILPGELILDGKSIPLDSNGSVILRYRGPSGTFKTYSAAAIIQSEIQIRNGQPPNIDDPSAFEDKYVFFGLSAPGLYDLRSAAVAGVFPGVEIYATMLDNFLSDDFIQNTPPGLTIALIFIFALGCAFAAMYVYKPAASLSVTAMAVSIPVLLCLGAYHMGFWLPMVVLETAGIATIVIVLVVNYAMEGRQRRFIKSAFQHFLSPEVIEQMIAHPDRLKLGGERKVLSIFFSDLRGFTSISEGMDPTVLTAILNDYLTAMTDIIHSEDGTIDKYEGDGIIAFWNAPLKIDRHAIRAVQAALRCQARLGRMRPDFKNRIGAELVMRIGIHTGPAVVGNMGSHARFDYTMLGDAVNLASRLEGANKQFGTPVMISQSTQALLENQFATRELARLSVVGRSEPVIVYEPMPHDAFDHHRKTMETFHKGLTHFYNGEFKRAYDVFSTIQKLDPPAEAYVQKCRELMETEVSNWQGIWVMETK